MAHQIDSIAYSGSTPWHQLGTRIPEDARRDFAASMTNPMTMTMLDKVIFASHSTDPTFQALWRNYELVDAKLVDINDQIRVLQDRKAPWLQETERLEKAMADYFDATSSCSTGGDYMPRPIR